MAPVDSSVSHASSNGGNSDHSGNGDVHVHSIHRMVDIPVVKSALGYASGFYSRVKGYNPTLESGLSRAEQTVLLVADSAKPVIQKLEKPINYADSLVCQGLDKLEEKVPSIKKSPDELKSAGWGTYEAIKSYGTDRLESLRSYVTTQATNASETQVAHVVIRSLDSALELADQAMDNYLPLGQDEQEGESDGGQKSEDGQPPTTAGIVEKAGRVSDKMRKRLLRTDLLLMKRALGLLAPVKELAGH